jgi:hypothetical protein
MALYDSFSKMFYLPSPLPKKTKKNIWIGNATAYENMDTVVLRFNSIFWQMTWKYYYTPNVDNVVLRLTFYDDSFSGTRAKGYTPHDRNISKTAAWR